jgi:NAD(P)H-dependent FMN reductase
MKILVLSSSLNPDSKSRLMAKEAEAELKTMGAETDFLDLGDYPLPLAGPTASWDDANAAILSERIAAARGILLAVPIYNYDVNAAAKNLIELTGPSWEAKVVGFICAAGGMGSYMSVMSLANSLMFDFRCLILPRFVYATDAAWDGDTIKDKNIHERIRELCAQMLRIAGAAKS